MPMNDEQLQRCRGIAKNVSTVGGTPVELSLVFLIEHLESQLAAREEKPPRMFPIQPQRGAPPHPLWIHWEVAELAYSNYAARFGRSQSLEELARRGGFCPYEMDDQLPGWRDMEAARGDLERENAELKAQLAAANKRAEEAEKLLDDGSAEITAELNKTRLMVNEARADAREMRRLFTSFIDDGINMMHPDDAKAVRAAISLAREEQENEARTFFNELENEFKARAEREPRDSDPSDDCAEFMRGPYRSGKGCVTDGHHMCSECECNEARADREGNEASNQSNQQTKNV